MTQLQVCSGLIVSIYFSINMMHKHWEKIIHVHPQLYCLTSFMYLYFAKREFCILSCSGFGIWHI